MKYFIAVISKNNHQNFEVCKYRGYWGMTRRHPASKRVGPGDKILFYLSQLGFKAEAIALGSMYELSSDSWEQYDFRNFKYGFRVEVITEFLRPHRYEFKHNINNEIGIKPGQLRCGFIEIHQSQYEKIILGEGQVLTPRTD